ncbi:hypothetical protein HY212_03080 [Candidatus Pacearchaeota archaeon]|nr:hypothetical protein [Candidatus Pacearchaeota archaeon]
MTTTSLEEIFSAGHVRNYAETCLNLAMSIPQQFASRNLDTLVIPSRGAVPIFIGATYALNKLGEAFGGEHKDFYDNLAVQSMIEPLMPHSSSISTDVSKAKYRVLLVPFTADLNVTRFYPSVDEDEYVRKTRNFWARFTGSFFSEPKDRAKNPYFKTFTDVVLRSIEGRDEIAQMYERFPKVEGFGLIDTVISGRASSQILQSSDQMFTEMGFKESPYYPFLIVDENSRKLRDPFRQFLKRKQVRGELEIHPAARIFSEDKGASFLGVAAVVYPSIMKESERHLLLNGSQEFFVGAGSWRLGSDLGRLGKFYKDSFDKFKGLIYSGIDHIFARDYGDNIAEQESTAVKLTEVREAFIKYADETGIMRGQGEEDYSVLRINKNYPMQEPYETGSGVVHVPFTPDATQKLIDKITRISPGVRARDSKSLASK